MSSWSLHSRMKRQIIEIKCVRSHRNRKNTAWWGRVWHAGWGGVSNSLQQGGERSARPSLLPLTLPSSPFIYLFIHLSHQTQKPWNSWGGILGQVLLATLTLSLKMCINLHSHRVFKSINFVQSSPALGICHCRDCSWFFSASFFAWIACSFPWTIFFPLNILFCYWSV